MNTAMEQLTQAQHKLAEALYKQSATAPGSGSAEGGGEAGSAGAGGSAGSAPGGAGEVIDAEVVDDK